MKGTPRTRQSPLTLAAFRPWGSSQDGRRAGSVGQCNEAGPSPREARPDPLGASRRAVSSPAEDWPSGLRRTIGNRVGLNTLTGSNPVSSAPADQRRRRPAPRAPAGVRASRPPAAVPPRPSAGTAPPDQREVPRPPDAPEVVRRGAREPPEAFRVPVVRRRAEPSDS